MAMVEHIHDTSAEASSIESSAPRSSSDIRQHTGKRRASGEMINREGGCETGQQATLQGQEDETCRPGLQNGSVVLFALPFNQCLEAEVPREQLLHGDEHHTRLMAKLCLRTSTRQTTTTTRWPSSTARGRHQITTSDTRRASRVAESQHSSTSPSATVTSCNRPILNATRTINLDMLQPHFERSLQQAADSFCVCTTLLKKICRRNGLNNWPYRKICGLRKSIDSMAKQVKHREGEQKRVYAYQLETLEYELQAYLRTGNGPTEPFARAIDVDTAAPKHVKAVERDIENEEKMIFERPSLEPPHYKDAQIDSERPIRPPTPEGSYHLWGMRSRGLQLQAPSFLTIATHHRVLPSIALILQHQSYLSPSRAASTQSASWSSRQWKGCQPDSFLQGYDVITHDVGESFTKVGRHNE